MSDPKGGDGQQADRPPQNIAAELDRKLGNFETKFQAQLAEVLNQIKSHTAPRAPEPKPAPSKKLSDLMYDDPDAFAEELETRVATKTSEVLESRRATEDRRNQTLYYLASEYPELNQPKSELKQRVEQILAELPVEERQNPQQWKMATLQAASEKGLRPASSRDGNDDFTLNSGGKPPAKPAEDEKLDAALDFARRMGRPVNDPKYRERLKKFAGRSEWMRWQTPGGSED